MPKPFGADEASLPTSPFALLVKPSDAAQLVNLAMRIARDAVVTDIESEGHKVQLDGYTWWDTRPMTDPHEHSFEVIDMATHAIQFAVGAGIASVHPQRPYLLTFEQQA